MVLIFVLVFSSIFIPFTHNYFVHFHWYIFHFPISFQLQPIFTTSSGSTIFYWTGIIILQFPSLYIAWFYTMIFSSFALLSCMRSSFYLTMVLHKVFSLILNIFLLILMHVEQRLFSWHPSSFSMTPFLHTIMLSPNILSLLYVAYYHMTSIHYHYTVTIPLCAVVITHNFFHLTTSHINITRLLLSLSLCDILSKK